MNIINWLRTPIATLIVLCSALLAQLPHAADVFRLVVMGDGWGPVLHSYTYAVALELAVLLFVVQRRNVESYLFAGVSILVNLSYYHLHGVALWTVAAAPAWLISIALPAAIAQYSHLIAAATDAHVAGVAPAAPAATPRRNWWQWWRKDAAPATQPAQQDEKEAQPARTDTQANENAAQVSVGHHEKLTRTQRIAHIQEQEITDPAQVAAQFGVSLRTAQGDLAKVREGLTQRNGGAQK